jgi:hypothetical protein
MEPKEHTQSGPKTAHGGSVETLSFPWKMNKQIRTERVDRSVHSRKSGFITYKINKLISG